MNLKQAIEEFIQWGNGKYMPRSLVTYENLLKRFLKSVGDRPLTSLELKQVVSYYTELKKKGYALSTIAYAMIAVRQFWKYLYLQRLVEIDWQLIPVPKYTHRSFTAATKDQAHRIMKQIGSNSFKEIRNKIIVSFLFASGVRVSELCDLKVSELNLEKRFASIVSKKNNQRRLIFWDDETHRLLGAYLEARGRVALGDTLIINIDPNSEYSFKKMTTRSVQKIVKEYRHKAGITEKITPHSFRHGLGMAAVKAKVHPRHIQIMLGHKNLNSSQIYMDVEDQDVIREYKKLANHRG